jgi:DNA transformation protein
MPHPGLVDHCLELLSPLGTPRARRMFGGHGLYVDELIVGLILRERLYLKTDESTRDQFAAAGSEPFRYDGARGEVTVTSYWSAPPEAMESPVLMQPWARLALQASVRSRAARPPRQRRAAAPGARRP